MFEPTEEQIEAALNASKEVADRHDGVRDTGRRPLYWWTDRSVEQMRAALMAAGGTPG